MSETPDPAASPATSPDHARPGRLRALVRRPVTWVAGLALAAVGGVVVTVLSGILTSAVDTGHLIDSTAGGPPVSVLQLQSYGGSFGWVLPDTVAADASIPPDTSANDANGTEDAWFERRGGVASREEDVGLTLQGNRHQPVIVTAMTPEVIACSAPPTGAVFVNEPQGALLDPHLEVDFDHHLPDFTSQGAVQSGQRPPPYFRDHSFSLADGEQLTVNITARASTTMCRWDIRLDEVVDGRPETQVIGAHSGLAVSGTPAAGTARSVFALGLINGHDGFDDGVAPETWDPVPRWWLCSPPGDTGPSRTTFHRGGCRP